MDNEDEKDEFVDYLKGLSYDEECKYMIKTVVNLCSVDKDCPYKGGEEYQYKGKRYRECKRNESIKFKKILGISNNSGSKIIKSWNNKILIYQNHNKIK